jgi:hypothetical protein
MRKVKRKIMQENEGNQNVNKKEDRKNERMKGRTH